MFALFDASNFYASVEQNFRPSLKGRPLIVLSSNDGCAIARSEEAKALGIKMGAPWFKISHLSESHGLVALSGNFTLYGDMGYGGMVFCNAFAYIATDPSDLRKGGYQVGPDNDSKILQACAMGTGDVMVAWGALGRGLARPQEVSRMVRKAGYRTLALGRTDDGLPLHPLRLAYATPVEVFLG